MAGHQGLLLERIRQKILLLRGRKVILDSDLAELYGVDTKRLKEQVRRNRPRFPEDFMFILNREEFRSLRTQIATSNRGGSRYLPIQWHSPRWVWLCYKAY
jgi:hypothetical protein